MPTLRSRHAATGPTTGQYDFVRKTGNTQHIATPPEEDRATATGNTDRKFGEVLTSGGSDTIADRQTGRRTRPSQYLAESYRGGVVSRDMQSPASLGGQTPIEFCFHQKLTKQAETSGFTFAGLGSK